MLAIVNTPGEAEPVAIREVAEPELQPNEALVAVRAFSLNRGELRLFQVRPEGWRPGQDIAGVVLRAAAVGRLLQHHPTDILPRPPALGPGLH